MKYHYLKGEEGREFEEAFAQLRLKVFYEFPYLYEGSLEYEKKYLETYFKAEKSFLFLVEDKGEIIGGTTGIWAKEEEDSFKSPLIEYGFNPEEVFYFGESILLNSYRGKGLGKLFFEEREKFARTIPEIKFLTFCSVVRNEDHPLKPIGYKTLDTFWLSRGFTKEEGLITSYVWKDREKENETPKKMQYWIKKIR